VDLHDVERDQIGELLLLGQAFRFAERGEALRELAGAP
jgi:hypothetical protein